MSSLSKKIAYGLTDFLRSLDGNPVRDALEDSQFTAINHYHGQLTPEDDQRWTFDRFPTNIYSARIFTR